MRYNDNRINASRQNNAILSLNHNSIAQFQCVCCVYVSHSLVATTPLLSLCVFVCDSKLCISLSYLSNTIAAILFIYFTSI